MRCSGAPSALLSPISIHPHSSRGCCGDSRGPCPAGVGYPQHPHRESSTPKKCPPTAPSLQRPPADGAMLGTQGPWGCPDGCGSTGAAAPLRACRARRRAETTLGDISAGGWRVRAPGPSGAEGGSVPPHGPPAELTSSPAQFPAPSLVLCLQPPLPVCRDTCEPRAPTVLPPADPTHRPPERTSPGAPGGRSRSCRVLPRGASPCSGPSASAAPPIQSRMLPAS